MKIISFLLAVILALSLFGCAAKEKENTPDDGVDKDAAVETTGKDEIADGGASDAPSDDGDDGEGEDGEEDGKADGEDGKNEGPSDSGSADTKDTDKVTSEPDGGDKTDGGGKTDGGEKDTAADTDSKKEPDTDKPVYSDGMLIEAYIDVVAGYFVSDYKRDGGAIEKDLLHATALFLYTQRQRTLEFSDDTSRFIIPAEMMEKNMKLLFGDNVSLSDYTSYLDADMGDAYDAEKEVFSFSVNREKWGESGYAVSFDHAMKAEETDDTFAFSVTLVNADGKERAVEYKFSKVVSDGYLYFRLEEVDKK